MEMSLILITFQVLNLLVVVNCGRRLLGARIAALELFGESQCLKACLRETDCLSLNYQKHQLLCELNWSKETEKYKVSENTPEAEGYIYIEKNKILQNQKWKAGVCDTDVCPSHQTCVVLKTGLRTCVTTSCGTDKMPLVKYGFSASLPESIQNNGSLTSGRRVGDTRWYSCAPGTYLVGSNNITCSSGGYWKSSEISCQVCLADDDPLGLKYWGTKNITVTGRWDSKTPHLHHFPPLPIGIWSEQDIIFPRMPDFTYKMLLSQGLQTQPGNPCRNPDKWTGGPWCFTMDPTKTWESCGVPKCQDVT